MSEIVVVGLGPGNFGLITAETLELLETARPLILRTEKHPTAAALRARGISFSSFDHIYEKQSTFAAVYRYIVEDLFLQASQSERIVYAVPGSPHVAEQTVSLLRGQAQSRNIPVRILPGMSFLDVLYGRLGIDPVNGVTILDASELGNLPPNLATALIITQMYNRQVASDTKLTLMNYYPDDYEITVVRHLSLDSEEMLRIPLYQLDRLPAIDHLTSVYIPPQPLKANHFRLDPLVDVMARLRSPGGCIWDIEQNHASLRRYMVEEVYEVLEAIDEASTDKLCEELGDLLLQVVFHARIAEECGHFSMQDVIDSVTSKLVRRHPHVFGAISVRDAAEVVMNWEKIKQGEKSAERHSVLDGIPQALPNLMRAYKLQAKAAKVGFDWPTVEPVWDKIQEEFAELREAVQGGNRNSTEGELGDLLFAVVNLARFLGIDPEIALNVTNNKFIRRFAHIEKQVKKRGLKWEECSLELLDTLWMEAKSKEL